MKSAVPDDHAAEEAPLHTQPATAVPPVDGERPAPNANGNGADREPSTVVNLKEWIAAPAHKLPQVLSVENPDGGEKFTLAHCPFVPEHDGSCGPALVQTADGTIAFACSGPGCDGKRFRDLRDLVEPGWRGPVEVKASPEMAAAMAEVERVVGAHYPDRVDALKASLAVVAHNSFADHPQPISLVKIARAGAGKTMEVSWLLPDGPNDVLSESIYRVDNLTAASFVSHRADLDAQQLRNVDLLPQLKNKTMVTKEMAPLFAGKREQLTERVSILTSVLDGRGYISNSGAHGRRGYEEDINFSWIGCTTPLSADVLSVMAQLGPRMLFYFADRRRKDVDQLAAMIAKGDDTAAQRECREAVRDFLLLLHRAYPAGSVLGASIVTTEPQSRTIALWAEVLTRLRTEVPELAAAVAGLDTAAIGAEIKPEHAERVFWMLLDIARSSALIHGRDTLAEYDLGQVSHIALSSGVFARSVVFEALLRTPGGTATRPELQRLTEYASKGTVLSVMRELAALGLADFTEEEASNQPAMATLRPPFTELAAAPRLKAQT